MSELGRDSIAVGLAMAVTGGAQAMLGDMGNATVLAQATAGTVAIPVWLLSLLGGALLSLVGWLLKRALDQVDARLARLDESVSKQAAVVADRFSEFAETRNRLEQRVTVVEARLDITHPPGHRHQ